MSKKITKNVTGGSATGGGINFQAASTAIVSVHILDGTPLGWLEGLLDDVPVSVAAETGGSGDDISIQFNDGSIAEAQVKKGLTATKRLWEPLISLAKAIHNKKIAYGLLVICPESSRSIRSLLSKDIVRLGDGRTDGLKDITIKFQTMLSDLSLPQQEVCQRLRIVVLHALSVDAASVQGVKGRLSHLCLKKEDSGHAWDRLYRDATSLIEFRTKRNALSLIKVLSSAKIEISDNAYDQAPIFFLEKFRKWSVEANSHFSIFGIDQALSIDDAWIPVKTIVQSESENINEGITEALKKYHSWGERTHDRDTKEVDPTTLGLYIKHCVVVAGPGMGKTTLLQKLFRFYTKQGQPTIIVRLPVVVARKNKSGSSFEESIFDIGLDGSGISFNDVSQSNFKEWTLLLDGLDECGQFQESICQSLLTYLSGFPGCRVVVTTRPIGYRTSLLKSWRHYELLPFEDNEASKNIKSIFCNVYKDDSKALKKVISFLELELEENEFSSAIVRSPLLMGLTASLSIRGIHLGKTKTALYKNLFQLIEGSPSEREVNSGLTNAILNYFINLLGWVLIKYPTEPIDLIINRCSISLRDELGEPLLKAKSISENSLSYWEAKGVVEKIEHLDGCFLTFIHKTFGEYSAGRYLAGLDEEKLIAEISAVENSQPLEEVLVFSGSLGAANAVSNELLKKWDSKKGGEEVVGLLLDIIGGSEMPPDKNIRDKVFGRASAELISLDRRHAFLFASKLILACKKFPDEVCLYTNDLMTHDQYWTRVSSWTFSLIGGAEFYDNRKLVDFIYEFYRNSRSGAYPSLYGGLVIGNSHESEINNEFVINAVTSIIDNCDSRDVYKIMTETVIKSNKHHSMGLMSKLSKVFKDRGMPDLAVKLYDFSSSISAYKSMFGDAEYSDRSANAIIELCSLLVTSENEGVVNDNESILLHFSAFLSAAGFWDSSLSDVINWTDGSFSHSIREVFRGLIMVSDISPEALSSESSSLLIDLNSESELDTSQILFERTIQIDTDPQWELAKNIDLDISLLEKAMLSNVAWIVVIAANLLLHKSDKEELLGSIARLFKLGIGDTLNVASNMAKYLDDDLCRKVVVDRLQKKLVPGCQYLYSSLYKTVETLDDEIKEVIKKGLFNSGPITAAEAAKLSGKFSSKENDDLYDLLTEAFNFWVINEEPYPVGDGAKAVPKSPRAEILAVLMNIKSPTNDELIIYLSDSRYDVVDVAKTILIDQLKTDDLLRDKFLEAVSSQVISSRHLTDAIREGVIFNDSQIEIICKMLNHQDAKIRFSAFKILDPKFISNEQQLIWLNVAMEDSQSEIREAAILLKSRL